MHKHVFTFLITSLILVLASIACGEPDPQSVQTASNSPDSTAPTSQISSFAPSAQETDYLVPEDIASIRKEWQEDRALAESKYVGQAVSVHGTYSFSSNLSQFIAVGGRIEDASIPIAHDHDKALLGKNKEEENRKARELVAWTENNEEGDPLTASCTIEGFFTDSNILGVEAGTLNFRDCELINDE